MMKLDISCMFRKVLHARHTSLLELLQYLLVLLVIFVLVAYKNVFLHCEPLVGWMLTGKISLTTAILVLSRLLVSARVQTLHTVTLGLQIIEAFDILPFTEIDLRFFI